MKLALIDILITVLVFAPLYWSGAHWWALLALPYGLWNYYQGKRDAIDSLVKHRS